MPSADLSRGRVRLGLDDVRVLGACLAGRPVPSELDGVHGGLVDAGLLDADGLPVARLRSLLEVLAGAELLVDVETAAPGVWVAHGAWATVDRAVVAQGWPGEREREYMLVEVAMLPWALAGLLAAYQASWRVTVRSLGDDDGQVRQLVVLDAGSAGYWRRDQPVSMPASDTAVVLARRSAAELWQEMIALLGLEPTS